LFRVIEDEALHRTKETTKVKNIGDKPMEPEYELSKMKRRPNPFAKQLKKQVTISLGIDVI